MPGISFVCDLKGGLRRESSFIDRAMDSLLHDPRYQRQEWLNDDFHYLGYSIYRQYPMSFFDLGDVTACLEGRFYGRKPAFDAEALSELKDAVVGADSTQDQVFNWLRKTDGDFAVILLHKETKDVF